MATKKILIQIQVGAKDASIAVEKVEKSLKGLSNAQVNVIENTKKLSGATKKNTASAGLHNAILMESGRLASDLNYGFTAIANNLGQLFSLFQASANSAEGLGAAFKKLLSIQAVFLIGGQLIIQNLDKITVFFKEVVFGVQDLSKVFNKASDTVKEVNGNFELYIATLQDTTKSEEEKIIAVERLNKEYPDYIENLQKADVTIEDVKNKTKAATEQNNLYRDSILELAISRAAQNEIERISGEILQEEIDLKKIQQEQGIKNEEQLQQALIDKQAEIDAEQERINLIIKSRAESKSRFATDSAIDKTRLSSLKKEKLALEGNLKSYLGFGETANARIKRLKEERDLYIQYVILGKERNKIDEKTREYQELDIGDGFEKEIQTIKDLGRIREEFFNKNLAQDVKDKETHLEKSELERIQALAEVNTFKGNEIQKRQARLEINAFYDKKDIEAKKKDLKIKQRLDDLEKKSKLEMLDSIGQGLMAASKIAGQSTGAGKALAVAGTLVSTYSAAQKAYESQMVPSIDSPVRAAIAAAAAIAQGLANVKAILSVKVAGMSSSSVSGGGPATVEAPDFNVVGASETSQLATSLAGVTGKPIQAFVVSKQVTTQQELDRNITTVARIN